jgi:hypothetical protein
MIARANRQALTQYLFRRLDVLAPSVHSLVNRVATARRRESSGNKMPTIAHIRIDHLPDEELAIQLWELAMAGDRGSDAFMRIDAEIHRRKSPGCAMRLETVTPSAPKSCPPGVLMSFPTRQLPPRIN